ncbi:type II toxin-antitoxin system Phd/YefM family antitoxin [Nocardioides sp.]|uniref:type II toxin-antitoxin system Phd/YefM family antitoxin n=1 Tax=Nocardioides sp. TaxID=35761 RepID=UPI002ED868C5
MSSIPVSEARANLPAVIASSADEAVVLERRGQRVAVVISPQRYDELMDAWEELEDVAAFDEVMAEGGPTIPWSTVKVDLGWE